MKKILFVICIFFISIASQAQSEQKPIDAKLKVKVREYMQLMEVDKNTKAAMEQSFSMFSGMGVGAGEEFKSKFIENIDYQGLFDIMIDAFAKIYTEEEIDGLIAFYKSPIGQSVVKKQTVAMTQTMELSQKWALEIISKMGLQDGK